MPRPQPFSAFFYDSPQRSDVSRSAIFAWAAALLPLWVTLPVFQREAMQSRAVSAFFVVALSEAQEGKRKTLRRPLSGPRPNFLPS